MSLKGKELLASTTYMSCEIEEPVFIPGSSLRGLQKVEIAASDPLTPGFVMLRFYYSEFPALALNVSETDLSVISEFINTYLNDDEEDEQIVINA